MSQKKKRNKDKLGRNDPCFCGSGRKFKKCCLPKQLPAKLLPVDETRFSAKELAEIEELHKKHILEKELQENALRSKGIFINLVQTIGFKGQRYYIKGNTISSDGTETTTFHDIIIRDLARVLGQEWWDSEVAKEWEDKHYLAKCFDKYQEFIRGNPEGVKDEADGRRSAVPNGYVNYLLNIAFDVYVLSHTRDVPPPDWLERIRSHDQFEGKRYEITVASIFARIGCKIEYLEDKRGSAKHPEFKITLDETGDQGMVEAKARTKAGTLNTKGVFDLKKATRLRVIPLINDALKKEVDDLPYFIFIEANFPENLIAPQNGKQWTDKVMESIQEHTPEANPEDPCKYNLLCVTNYAQHYDEDNMMTSRKIVYTIPLYPAVVLKDEQLPEFGTLNTRLQLAIQGYGFVPNL